MSFKDKIDKVKIFSLIVTMFLSIVLFGMTPLELLQVWADSSAPPHTQKKLSVVGVGGVPVLMYHHVGGLPEKPDQTRIDLTVSTKDFNAQVSFLAKLGYNTITTAQLDAWLKGDISLPNKPIIFSFDDGYADVFQNAAPILQHYNMTGTFAVVPGFVGTKDYADWQQLISAKASGMEIVCHSEYHMDFTNPIYPESMKLAEVSDCKSNLENQLGVDSATFVYPYGHFNSDLQSILKNQRFDLAFTTAYGFVNKGQNPLELPRVRVHGREMLEIFAKNLGLRLQGPFSKPWASAAVQMSPAK